MVSAEIECAYCGSNKNLTDDHVPPESFFPSPRPSNLITVPSCESCNQGFQKDDDYFRTMVLLRKDLSNNPAVKKMLPKLYKAFRRPQQRGLNALLLNNVFSIPIHSTAGLYLGNAPAYYVYDLRIRKTIDHITKGLFYYENGYRLPSEFSVVTYSEYYLSLLSEEVQNTVKNKFIPKLIQQGLKINYENIFSCWKASVPSNNNLTSWFFIFYNRVSFFSMTLPQSFIDLKNGIKGSGPEFKIIDKADLHMI